jgi:phage/plasmid-like protein (TIGR03299 family)
MAHNLNIENGKAAFASAIVPAWHGLGQVVEKAMTSTEALTLAGLDYTVTKEPIFIQSGKKTIKIEDKFATTRSDNGNPLGVVGSHVLQNTEAFDWFDGIIGAKEAIFETAGALGKGETVFITAKMPNHISVGKDVVEQYLLLTNNHSGQSAIQMMFTPVRVVCQNTLNAALGCCSNRAIIRHTSGAQGKMQEAIRALGIANTYFEELKQAFVAMNKVKITDQQLKDFIRKSIAPRAEIGNAADAKASHKTTDEMLEKVYVYALNHDSQKGIERNLYGAFNSISGYYNNVKEWNNADARMKSIIDGRAHKAMQRAFEIATTFINN